MRAGWNSSAACVCLSCVSLSRVCVLSGFTAVSCVVGEVYTLSGLVGTTGTVGLGGVS